MGDLQVKPYQAFLLAAAIALAGVILIFVITKPWGLRMTSDSAAYYQAGRSFAMGDGLLNYDKDEQPHFMTHHAPLYAVFLAAGMFFSMNIPDWARCFNAFLFGTNIFLAAWLAFYMTGRLSAVAITGFLMLTCVHLLKYQASALTEPFFITLVFAFLWSLMRFRQERRMYLLVAAALLAGVCYLTRYAGLSVIITGGVVLWMDRRKFPGETARHMRFFLGLALIAPAVWMLRNYLIVRRPIGFLLNGSVDLLVWALNQAGVVLDVFSRYLLPTEIPLAVRIVALVLIIIASFFAFKKFWVQKVLVDPSSRLGNGWRVISAFLLVYMVGGFCLIALSRGVVFFDLRILLPLAVVLIPLWGTWIAMRERKALVTPATAVIVILMGFMLARTVQFSINIYKNGDGYISRRESQTPVVKAVKALPDDVPVYTDDTRAFYAYTGRPAVQIPMAENYSTYNISVDAVRERFVRERAVAVIFYEQWFNPKPVWWQVVRSVPLIPVLRDELGVIYCYKRPAGEK